MTWRLARARPAIRKQERSILGLMCLTTLTDLAPFRLEEQNQTHFPHAFQTHTEFLAEVERERKQCEGCIHHYPRNIEWQCELERKPDSCGSRLLPPKPSKRGRLLEAIAMRIGALVNDFAQRGYALDRPWEDEWAEEILSRIEAIEREEILASGIFSPNAYAIPQGVGPVVITRSSIDDSGNVKHETIVDHNPTYITADWPDFEPSDGIYAAQGDDE